MQVTTSLLCDFAQVREGVLFVASGGVTRLWRDGEPPFAMGVVLALVIEMDAIESQRPHELQVVVLGEDGVRHAEIQGGFQLQSPPDAEPWEHLNLPLTFDLRNVGLPTLGRYDAAVYIDGNHHRTLTFLAARRTQTPSA